MTWVILSGAKVFFLLKVETGISITPELAAGAVDGTDFGADEVDPSNKKMEQRKLESIGKG